MISLYTPKLSIKVLLGLQESRIWQKRGIYSFPPPNGVGVGVVVGNINVSLILKKVDSP